MKVTLLQWFSFFVLGTRSTTHFVYVLYLPHSLQFGELMTGIRSVKYKMCSAVVGA